MLFVVHCACSLMIIFEFYCNVRSHKKTEVSTFKTLPGGVSLGLLVLNDDFEEILIENQWLVEDWEFDLMECKRG